MSDCGCGNQCGEKFCEVKVYEYSILSVRPCHEEVLQKTRSLVITSNMSGEAFSNYAIALYCRGKEITKEQARYLRVCYRIMCTLPKESKGCCDNDQVEVLREIKNVLKKALTGSKQPPGAGAAGTSSAAQASAAA